VYNWLKTRPEPVSITALHVVPIAVMGEMGVEDQMVKLDLEAVRSQLAELIQDAPVPITLQVEAGHPGQVIAQAARGYDMLVVGTRKSSQLAQLLLGGTTDYIRRNAPCPVVVVGPDGVEA
jgi:nucleotide-binding universal stress UspA family protein